MVAVEKIARLRRISLRVPLHRILLPKSIEALVFAPWIVISPSRVAFIIIVMLETL